jgi:hypothetical protein
MRLIQGSRITPWLAAAGLSLAVAACGGEPCGGLCDKAESCGLTDCEITSCPSDPDVEECLVGCYQSASCGEVVGSFTGSDTPSLDACLAGC